MAYRDYYMELDGSIPKLGVAASQKYVQRAWKEIQDRYPWSWLIGHVDVLSPALVTTGTVSVTQGDTSVTFDADAQAVLDVLGLNPPLAGEIGTGRQIRVGSGPVYTILTYDAGAGVLDRAYAESTNATATYQIFKCIYSLPSDGSRYTVIVNTTTGYAIYGDRLNLDRRRLDARDPDRGSSGDAYWLSPHSSDSNGRTAHEWWPHPTNAAVYHCVYRKRYLELSDTVDIPATVDDALLMSSAKMHAARWALANVGVYPELGQTNWVNFIALEKSEFQDKLKAAVRHDSEMNPLLPMLRRFGVSNLGVLGGQFAQSHDLSGI